ncbi:unnamed protein product [Schistosoma margrebowiei]|uniref:Uncharacterized protein n=1 Tax=Schistosoma margrebowiei TaxID=48269 RepID=A0A183LPA5_9TREM|nr:unnamed protein product [Schistosoma margrebowiei]
MDSVPSSGIQDSDKHQWEDSSKTIPIESKLHNIAQASGYQDFVAKLITRWCLKRTESIESKMSENWRNDLHQYLLDYQLAAASASVGLNIHKGKSKNLEYNTVSTNPIRFDGEALEDVESFTHLVSIIDEQEGSDADVKAKIGKARAAFLLLKNIWNSNNLIDWIMKTSTSEGKREIQWTSKMQLDDIDFADDLALLSQPQQQMKEKMTSVAAASAAVGLNIHKGKSKILRQNTACTNPITIDGEDLEDVKTFTDLGSIIDEHGGSDADVKARIGKARAAYLQLRNIWNSKQLSYNTKVRIFNTNVKTVLQNVPLHLVVIIVVVVDSGGGSELLGRCD